MQARKLLSLYGEHITAAVIPTSKFAVLVAVTSHLLGVSPDTHGCGPLEWTFTDQDQ